MDWNDPISPETNPPLMYYMFLCTRAQQGSVASSLSSWPNFLCTLLFFDSISETLLQHQQPTANSSSYSSCSPTPTRTTRSLFFLYKVNVWHVYKCVQFTYWCPVQWLDQTYHIIECKCKNNQFKEEFKKYSSRSGEYKVRLLNAKPEKELILFVDHNT